MLHDVDVTPVSLQRLGPIIGPQRLALLLERAARLRTDFAGRTLWSVNSTASGGGVAEMMYVLTGYAKGAGVDMQWVVIEGDPLFFRITKRLHHRLHGMPGDGGPLGEAEAAHYRAVMDANAEDLRARVHPGDVVLMHDPQTAGLAPYVRDAGAYPVWRCHIGADAENECTIEGWSFLRPALDAAVCLIFSRPAYVPAWVPARSVAVIPPSIDPFSPKNQPLLDETVVAILDRVGLIQPCKGGSPVFTRRDGTPGEVVTRAQIVTEGPPPADAPLVVQVSRWDPLKDMLGVLRAFASIATAADAHLALVGPVVTGVSDDPEGAAVLSTCIDEWRALPADIRARIHLVSLPMHDIDENAAMVNAIQRHACIVVQKSLAEGFGLTVTEAMWKGRAVIASAVGGIRDQLTPGTGVLLPDPRDLDAAARAMRDLLVDEDRRVALGQAAHAHVKDSFVGDVHVQLYIDLMNRLIRQPMA